MKKEDQKWIIEKIMDFMVTINDCLISTTYADDREAYMKDLAMVAMWLVRIYKKEPIINIGLEIVNEKTGKYFGDYWKKNPWGGKEIEALENLQSQIKGRLNISSK